MAEWRAGTRLHGREEFVRRHISLPQDTKERADFEFLVHGNNATFGSTPHDDVASGLTEHFEAQALKRTYDCGPWDSGQLRHGLEL